MISPKENLKTISMQEDAGTSEKRATQAEIELELAEIELELAKSTKPGRLVTC